MAQYAQITRTGGFTDITVFNNAATAIQPGYCVLAETVSGKELAVALPTGSGGTARLLGVSTSVIPAGGYGTVCVHGPAVVYAHEALATGAFVQADDTTSHLGEVKALLTSSTQEAIPCVGRVLYASGADGDACLIYVNVAPVTTAA